MGTFFTSCVIANPADRTRTARIQKLLVDTGSECTWAPTKALERIGVTREKTLTFVLANGQDVTRGVGFAVIHLDRRVTVDEVVFAEPGDLLLLGARTLEGLNVTIDAARKRLVSAGPHFAATPVRVRG
jgi:predicted aspartyl protease